MVVPIVRMVQEEDHMDFSKEHVPSSQNDEMVVVLGQPCSQSAGDEVEIPLEQTFVLDPSAYATQQQQQLTYQPMGQQQNPAGVHEFGTVVFIGPGVSMDKRREFMQKVLLIVVFQLAATLGVSLFMMQRQEDVLELFSSHFWLIWVFMVVLPIVTMLLGCFREAFRKAPRNWIMLFVFTVLWGLFIGLISCAYSASWVATSWGITTLVTLLLTLFACQTKYDITGWGPYLFVVVMVIFLSSLIAGVLYFAGSQSATMLGFLSGWHAVYGGLMILLSCIYIVYDVQRIMGGTHKKCQFAVDDYCFAALNLYLDIIDLFLSILATDR